MNDIIVNNLYINFLDTISNCGTYLLNESDEVLTHKVFEEFDIGLITFLHEKNLKILLENKLINHDIFNDSLKLRGLGIQIQEDGKWNLLFVRSSADWLKLFEIGDQINLEMNTFNKKHNE